MNELYKAALKYLDENPCDLTGYAASHPIMIGAIRIPTTESYLENPSMKNQGELNEKPR